MQQRADDEADIATSGILMAIEHCTAVQARGLLYDAAVATEESLALVARRILDGFTATLRHGGA